MRECRFPIDVVYTWVDGEDPSWNEAREQRLAGLTGTARLKESSGRASFTARDELRYSMRSIHLFAPWVRRIHLVTAGQVPDWLDLTTPGSGSSTTARSSRRTRSRRSTPMPSRPGCTASPNSPSTGSTSTTTCSSADR